MPAAKKSDVEPWKETVKSSAGSLLLVRNRMIGWPRFAPWRSVSITKLGWLCVPNSRLNRSMQLSPHDGVAAPADSAAIAPTPPTRVSVAAAAKTLLLMVMKLVPPLEPQPCPAHDCRATTAACRPTGSAAYEPRQLDTER